MSTSNPHNVGKTSVNLVELAGDERKQIEPKDLSIIWGKDNRYWNVPEKEGEAAELYQVSWLEVTGCVSETEPDKEYRVGFNISLTADAFGWSGSPVYILVKRGKTGKFKGHKFELDKEITKPDEQKDIHAKIEPTVVPTDADADADAKHEISKIYFGLYEVWRGKWKGGLKIHHAFIQQI